MNDGCNPWLDPEKWRRVLISAREHARLQVHETHHALERTCRTHRCDIAPMVQTVR